MKPTEIIVLEAAVEAYKALYNTGYRPSVDHQDEAIAIVKTGNIKTTCDKIEIVILPALGDDASAGIYVNGKHAATVQARTMPIQKEIERIREQSA